MSRSSRPQGPPASQPAPTPCLPPLAEHTARRVADLNIILAYGGYSELLGARGECLLAQLLVVLPIHRVARATSALNLHTPSPAPRPANLTRVQCLCDSRDALYMRAGMNLALASDEEIAKELAKKRKILDEALEEQLRADVALLEVKVEIEAEDFTSSSRSRRSELSGGGASHRMSASHRARGRGATSGSEQRPERVPDAIAAVVSMCVVSVVSMSMRRRACD